MTDYMQSLLPELDGYRAALFQQRGVAPSTLAAPFDVPTLRDDVIDVLDTLGWEAPAMIGHSWGGHLLLHLLAVTPTRVGAALAVDPLGAVGDGGVAAFEAELLRRLPEATVARLKELEGVETTEAWPRLSTSRPWRSLGRDTSPAWRRRNPSPRPVTPRATRAGPQSAQSYRPSLNGSGTAPCRPDSCTAR